jgi:hypothetical protein
MLETDTMSDETSQPQNVNGKTVGERLVVLEERIGNLLTHVAKLESSIDKLRTFNTMLVGGALVVGGFGHYVLEWAFEAVKSGHVPH